MGGGGGVQRLQTDASGLTERNDPRLKSQARDHGEGIIHLEFAGMRATKDQV